MFVLSLSNGIIPRRCKKANVVSLFKKGSRCKLDNNRPICLASIIRKLLEKLIKEHLLISKFQYGFNQS